MKSEKRHQLETNYLADWLARTLKNSEPYQKPVVWAILAVVVLIGASVAWSKWTHWQTAAAWDEFNIAAATGAPSEFDRIAEEHPGTDIAFWSRATAGDIRLDRGSMQIFTDKAAAVGELRKAIDDYAAVIDGSREPQLRQRALFGRARAYESLSGTPQGAGELPKAIADYEEIAQKYPTGSYATIVGDQLKRLKSQDIKVFYDKFAQFAPKRPVSKEPGPDGKPIPFDASSLPDAAGQADLSKLLKLDAKTKDGTPAAESAKTDAGKAAPKKTDAVTPPVQPKEPVKSAPAKTESTKATTPAPSAVKPEPAKK